MTVTLSLFAGAGAQFLDNSGNPLSGGKIYTYQAGTTTPQATYSTNSGATAHTNPIVLDAAGRVPSGGEIWLTSGVGYKFIVKTSTEVLIATYDNIPSSAQPPAANDADSIMYEQGYTVTAGNFVVGEIYRIATLGTTDFTLIGAVNNVVNTHFIATGVGSGTGTAELSQTVETKLRETVSVKDFGAVGDGVTNDTDAFVAASAYINLIGGGKLIIPPGTYIVGKQTFAGAFGQGYSYKGNPILSFISCTLPVYVEGYGAKLKVAAGLKFGSFDPVTGAVYTPSGLPFTNYDYAASVADPGIIRANSCSEVVVAGVEIDGNIANVILGGQWGDSGYQIASSGLHFQDCDMVTVRDVNVHHNALDGVYVTDSRTTSEDSPTYPCLFENVLSEYNARQGMSLTGGKGITCIRCKFNHTGRGAFSSAPSAGVDLEPNAAKLYDVSLKDCELLNNVGVGLLCDINNKVYNVTVDSCTIWGVTNWSLWMKAEYFVATNCKIYGAVVNLDVIDANTEPSKAPKFKNCLFQDRTYNGSVYGTVLCNLSSAFGVSFEQCDFVASAGTIGTIGATNASTRFNSIRLTDCRFLMKYDGLANKGSQLLLRGCSLLRCNFSDSYATPPADAYAVTIDNVYVQDGVYMDTTKTNWGSWALFNGPIPQNVDQMDTYALLLHRLGGYTTRNAIYTAAAAPVSGTYNQGDRVLNVAPSVGQPKGWICTVSGTPGTWVSEGNL